MVVSLNCSSGTIFSIENDSSGKFQVVLTSQELENCLEKNLPENPKEKNEPTRRRLRQIVKLRSLQQTSFMFSRYSVRLPYSRLAKSL